MRIMLLSLRTLKDGKSDLNFNLTQCIDDFFNHQSDTLQIKLPSGELRINKWAYLNKGKIYDTGKEFFLVANKQFNQDYAFKLLMEYAILKLDTRIEHLKATKNKYEMELQVA